MAQKQDFSDLSTQQESLIFALLRSKTKQQAAVAAGVPARTMYNWFADQKFRSAYRAARRSQFNDALGTLERGSRKAAEVLVDMIDSDAEPAVIVSVCKAVIDRAFKAQDAITVAEELDDLQAYVTGLKNAATVAKAPALPAPAEVRTMVTDNAEAFRLRVEWMALIGNGGQDIADSLRYNPPQSIVEKQGMLECVRGMLAQEKLEAELLAQANAESGPHE